MAKLDRYEFNAYVEVMKDLAEELSNDNRAEFRDLLTKYLEATGRNKVDSLEHIHAWLLGLARKNPKMRRRALCHLLDAAAQEKGLFSDQGERL